MTNPDELNMEQIVHMVALATFREMNDADRDEFAGAEPGALIAESDSVILLLNPKNRTYGGCVSVIGVVAELEDLWQVDLYPNGHIERVI